MDYMILVRKDCIDNGAGSYTYLHSPTVRMNLLRIFLTVELLCAFIDSYREMALSDSTEEERGELLAIYRTNDVVVIEDPDRCEVTNDPITISHVSFLSFINAWAEILKTLPRTVRIAYDGVCLLATILEK